MGTKAHRICRTYEDFKTKNFTVDDLVACVDRGGVIYATVVDGMPGNDPEAPLRPVSVDDEGAVTVSVDGTLREVALRNIDRIEWAGDRVTESLNMSEPLKSMLDYLGRGGDKVAELLHFLNSSEAYADGEEVNMLDLAEEMNKFSFLPRNRRTDDYRFDPSSMPTRIGRLVNKIYSRVKGSVHLKRELEVFVTTERDGVYVPGSGSDRRYVVTPTKEGFNPVCSNRFGRVQTRIRLGDKWYEGPATDIRYRWMPEYYQKLGFLFAPGEPMPLGKHDAEIHMESNLRIDDADIEAFVVGVVAYLRTNRVGKDFEIESVRGEDVRFWYNEANYQSKRGELGNSCMADKESQKYLDLYCKNPDRVSLLIIKSPEGLLLARALLWELDGGGYFMDRVYAIVSHDARLFHEHAIKHGFMYKKNRLGVFLGGEEYTDAMRVTLKNHEFKRYPYLDTLKFLSPQGVLGSVPSGTYDRLLCSVDGKWEVTGGGNDEQEDDEF